MKALYIAAALAAAVAIGFAVSPARGEERDEPPVLDLSVDPVLENGLFTHSIYCAAAEVFDQRMHELEFGLIMKGDRESITQLPLRFYGRRGGSSWIVVITRPDDVRCVVIHGYRW